MTTNPRINNLAADIVRARRMTAPAPISPEEIATDLIEAINGHINGEDSFDIVETLASALADVESVQSYGDGGYLTTDAGFVMTRSDGTRIMVTITEQPAQ